MRLSASSSPEIVEFIFYIDGIAREGNETLTLHLIPPPSTIQTMPTGEAVFFENNLELTIMDADCKCSDENNSTSLICFCIICNSQ